MSGPFREPLPRLQGVQERCSPELPRMENPLASHPSTQLISGPAPRRSQDLPAELSLEQGWPRGMQPSQLQGARRWEGLLLGSELCCHRFETLHDFCTRGPTLSSRTGPRSSAVSPAPTQVGAEQSGHRLTCWDPDHQEYPGGSRAVWAWAHLLGSRSPGIHPPANCGLQSPAPTASL